MNANDKATLRSELQGITPRPDFTKRLTALCRKSMAEADAQPERRAALASIQAMPFHERRNAARAMIRDLAEREEVTSDNVTADKEPTKPKRRKPTERAETIPAHVTPQAENSSPGGKQSGKDDATGDTGGGAIGGLFGFLF